MVWYGWKRLCNECQQKLCNDCRQRLCNPGYNLEDPSYKYDGSSGYFVNSHGSSGYFMYGPEGYMTGSRRLFCEKQGYIKSSRLYKWIRLSMWIFKVI